MLAEPPEGNDKSLDELFLEGYSKFHISKQSSLALFINLDFKIQKLSLFSNNETRLDLNDKYLKFLLIPAFIGLGMIDYQEGDRFKILSRAKSYLKEYLGLMENYEFISTQDLVSLFANCY